MATEKFINLNFDRDGNQIDFRQPKGKYINEWEIVFKKGTASGTKKKVRDGYLEQIFNNNFGDNRKTITIEYEWYHWGKGVNAKYSLIAYRIPKFMTIPQPETFDLNNAKPGGRNAKTKDVTIPATPKNEDEGGPQPSGPQLPTPASVATIVKKDLIPDT